MDISQLRTAQETSCEPQDKISDTTTTTTSSSTARLRRIFPTTTERIPGSTSTHPILLPSRPSHRKTPKTPLRDHNRRSLPLRRRLCPRRPHRRMARLQHSARPNAPRRKNDALPLLPHRLRLCNLHWHNFPILLHRAHVRRVWLENRMESSSSGFLVFGVF